MRGSLFLLLALCLAGCATQQGRYDIRDYPTAREGVVAAGYSLPADWNLDVWVLGEGYTGQLSPTPSFTLAPRGQHPLMVMKYYQIVTVYAEAWIWDGGKQVVVARTKYPIKKETGVVRGWDGNGWAVSIELSDFDDRNVVASSVSMTPGVNENFFANPPVFKKWSEQGIPLH